MKNEGIKIVVKNRKARFNYDISERIEAGIVLVGSEVKSMRDGRVSMGDSYARFMDGELWLVGCHISEYPFANRFNHEPLRPRKLLLHKRELKRLTGKVIESGYSLVPLCIYFRKGKVKIELGLGKGRKLHDKRHEIKRRDMQRDAERDWKR